nr:protein decapping 5-like [Ipomoea batatas]
MEEAVVATMAAIDAGRGSLVNLLTRCGARYQGYVSRVDSPEFMIALTNVKCFGTEGRRLDGQEYAGSERIYEFIIFRGSEVLELQFLTLPPAQIGLVPNYMAGSIAQTSTSTLLPMQNPGAGTATVAGLQHPPLLPVGPSSSSGQYATPESSLQTELQFLNLPPGQIGFVPNYMAGSIAHQTSPSTLLPVQNPGGTATVAGLQHPPLLLPVGPANSTNLYPPTTHSSSGQWATPESSLQTELQFLTMQPAQIGFVPNYMAGSIAHQASTSTLLPMQNPGGTATVAGLQHPPLLPIGPSSSSGQCATPAESSLQTASQPVSQSFPTPSALGGLLPTPQQGRLPTPPPQGSSGRGRGSVASGQGRGKQQWRRRAER